MARGGAALKRKVLGRMALAGRVAALRRAGKRVVFTNGCFDILHVGHVRYLGAAKKLGDVLIVGVNSDVSARRLNKGPGRPVNRESDRAEMLAALEMVDYVTLFAEDTPYELIRRIAPDVLVKGGDWVPSRIVGAILVRARGGKVKSLPYAKGYSTSEMIEKMTRR